MRVMSWNVNSVRVRTEQVERVVKEIDIDVLALQETKCSKEDFPVLLQDSHPHQEVLGNKGLSGVAFLSKRPCEIIQADLPEDALLQPARLLHIKIGSLHFINVYVPNGESLDSDKFVYKQKFMQHLRNYIKPFSKEQIMVMGDFNIIPSVRDMYSVEHFAQRLFFSPIERRALSGILAEGLMDVGSMFLEHCAREERYTWWDYRNMADFPSKGLRIDLVLASYKAVDNIVEYGQIKQERLEKRPSDHIPVWFGLKGSV